MADDLTPSKRREIVAYTDPPLPYSQEIPPADVTRLEDVWELAWRNRWLVLACLVVAISLAVVYNRMTTPIYESWARIRIEDPETATNTGVPLLNVGSADEIETEIEVIRSRDFAGYVVDSLGLQLRVLEGAPYMREDVFSAIEVASSVRSGEYVLERRDDGRFELVDASGEKLANGKPGELIQGPGFAVTLSSQASRHSQIRFTASSREAAAGRVVGNLIVQRVNPNVNIIRVGYRSPDRSLAARVPDAIAEQFLLRRRATYSTEASTTIAFLREQIDSIGSQLRTAEDSLQAFQESSGAVEPVMEGNAAIGQLAGLEVQLDAIEADRTAIGQLLEEARAVRDTNPVAPSPYRRLMAFPGLINAQSTSSLLSTLNALETERGELLSRRNPADPDVQALTERIDILEEELYGNLSTYHRGLANQATSIRSSMGRERGQLSQIPRKAVEMTRRHREVELLQGVYTLLQTRLKEAEITEAVEDPAARIVERAALPGAPIEPRSSRNLIIATILGLLGGMGLAVMRERLDRTVHTREQVRAITLAPVLGMIPHFDKKAIRSNGGRVTKLLPGNRKRTLRRKKARAKHYLAPSMDPNHIVAEAFRSLRTNITFTASERQPRTLVLTSALPEDGKTTTVANLTHAFAQQGLRVILVDADMRRGMIHELFGVAREPGLSNVLVQTAEIEEAVRSVTMGDGLSFDVLPAGRVPSHPAELLASQRLLALLQQLVRTYDQVILDTPPLSLVTDAVILSHHVDSVMVVVRAGHTDKGALAFAMEQLRHVDAPVKGTILNDIDPRDRSYGGYNYYGYKSSYYSSDS